MLRRVSLVNNGLVIVDIFHYESKYRIIIITITTSIHNAFVIESHLCCIVSLKTFVTQIKK